MGSSVAAPGWGTARAPPPLFYFFFPNIWNFSLWIRISASRFPKSGNLPGPGWPPGRMLLGVSSWHRAPNPASRGWRSLPAALRRGCTQKGGPVGAVCQPLSASGAVPVLWGSFLLLSQHVVPYKQVGGLVWGPLSKSTCSRSTKLVPRAPGAFYVQEQCSGG